MMALARTQTQTRLMVQSVGVHTRVGERARPVCVQCVRVCERLFMAVCVRAGEATQRAACDCIGIFIQATRYCVCVCVGVCVQERKIFMRVCAALHI